MNIMVTYITPGSENIVQIERRRNTRDGSLYFICSYNTQCPVGQSDNLPQHDVVNSAPVTF